jgi:hypothetical protein
VFNREEKEGSKDQDQVLAARVHVNMKKREQNYEGVSSESGRLREKSLENIKFSYRGENK